MRWLATASTHSEVLQEAVSAVELVDCSGRCLYPSLPSFGRCRKNKTHAESIPSIFSLVFLLSFNLGVCEQPPKRESIEWGWAAVVF